MKTKIITIHGTFAPKARWAQRESLVCQRISKSIGNSPSIFPLDWSGDNSFVARELAADKLITLLKTEGGDAQIVMLTHSHGGSIAHYAYKKNPVVFQNVKAIACLATPFMGFSIRPGYRALNVAVIAALFLWLLQILLYISMLAGKRIYPRLLDEVLPIMAIGVIIFAALLGVAGWIFKNRARFYTNFKTGIHRTSEWDTTLIQMPNVGFFRSMGDEVALASSAGQFISTLISFTLNFIASVTTRIVDLMNKWSKSNLGKMGLVLICAIFVVIAALPAALSVTFGDEPKYWLDLLWAWNNTLSCFVCDSLPLDHVTRAAYQILVIVFVIPFLIAGLFVLVLITGWGLSFLLLRAFGAWSFFTALVVEFTVEPIPEGRQNFINTGWSRDPALLEKKRPLFQHSDPYSSENALDALCKWLKEKLLNSETNN